MKQCGKCAWKYYNYTKPICERARQILHDFEAANEIFSKYKNLDCQHFIPKNTKQVTITVVGGKDYFFDLIDKYKANGGENELQSN